MRVLSLLNTAIAYDANKPKDHTVVIRPGHNVLSDKDKEVLDVDPHFPKHVELGHMVIQPDEAPAPAPVAGDEDDDKEDATDPRARQPGESKNAHKARLKLLDATPPAPVALSGEDQGMVDAYKALTTDEARENFKVMLDNRQREVLAQATAPKEGE